LSKRTGRAVTVAAVAWAVLLTACSDDDTPAASNTAPATSSTAAGGATPSASGTGGGSATPSASGAPAAGAQLPDGCAQLPFTAPSKDKDDVLNTVLAELPKEQKDGYSNYVPLLAKSPYATFKAKPGPWKVGYANSFSGNAWRASAHAALSANFAAAKEQGLVEGDLIVTDSNGKNDVQIQQIRSMIQQGVDIIFTIPGSATALNGVIKEAFDAGIPVLTVASPVDTEYAINMDNNQFLYGARQTQGLMYLLEGKGKIVTVQGIKGTPGSLQIQEGSDAVIKSCPDVEVVANFSGDWNNATAKTEMLKTMSSKPQDIDGVFEQGSMGKGIIEALQQTGRKVVPVTMGNPDQAELAYWRDHAKDGYRGAGTAQPSGAAFDAAFRVGMRVLEGKGLKVNAIVGNPPMILDKEVAEQARSTFEGVSIQTLDEWVKDTWTFDSPGVANPAAGPEGTWFPDKTLDMFFTEAGTGYKGISSDVWDK
jgi:ribose transport system substrate-binding protein